MSKDLSKRLAYAGVMTALQIIAVVASFYIKYISIALSFLATLFLVILLSKGYLRESIISYIATSLVGFFIGGITFIIPYILFYGAYTIISFVINKYLKIKIIKYVISSIYGAGLTVVIIKAFKLFVENKIVSELNSNNLYFALFVIFTALLINVYDIVLVKLVYPYIETLLNKIDKPKGNVKRSSPTDEQKPFDD